MWGGLSKSLSLSKSQKNFFVETFEKIEIIFYLLFEQVLYSKENCVNIFLIPFFLNFRFYMFNFTRIPVPTKKIWAAYFVPILLGDYYLLLFSVSTWHCFIFLNLKLCCGILHIRQTFSEKVFHYTQNVPRRSSVWIYIGRLTIE